ncbi:hypothetical protein [Pseudodesulfovibrio sediminis]|uniref:hypothetical protein n=1 Tax=Pseudodesulfovibrio sediminis TaxID=2810563 RepID=UPI001E377F92|nr:hypothetical protein [Pseudodesulfovibrio sediminis]
MNIRSMLWPLQIVTNLFPRNGGVNIKLVTGIVFFSICQLIALVVATHHEGTFSLPGVGKGLMEHEGVWAIVITDPLLLISTGYAYALFRKCMRTLPIKNPGSKGTIKKTLFQSKLSHLLMKEAGGQLIYALLVVVGLFAFANNIVQTCNPAIYYGNDVFDSSKYVYGFITNKFNLFVSWTIVYPIVAYFCLTMSASIYLILKKLRDSGQLVAEMHHPDKCFGYSQIGTLNLVLMLPFFLTYNVMFFLADTHESAYLSLLIPLVGMTAVFIGISYMTLYPLAAFIREECAKQAGVVQGHLRNAMEKGTKPRIRVVLDSMYLSMMHGTPYTKNARSLITALRIATLTMTAYRTFIIQAQT